MEMTRRTLLCGAATTVATAMLPAEMNAIEEGKRRTRLKILVMGAHPDDPESGCGGTIALYTRAGHEAVNVYLTRGEAGIAGKSHEEAAQIRTGEAEEACRILGARPLFVGQIDGATELTPKWYDEVRRILESEKPDLVLTQWPVDGHRDHRVMGLLVYDAWLRLHKVFELFYYEVEAGIQSQCFRPTHYIDISNVESCKRKACFAHKSQHPDGGFYGLHEDMHMFRGREGGVEAAEAFIHHSHATQGLL